VYRPLKPVAVQTSIVLCRRREPGQGVVELFVETLRGSDARPVG
jgi:hypothetical protein